MTPYNVCAYWKARRETIDACAERLTRFLTSLSTCDAVFSKWFRLGTSRRRALQNAIDFRNRESVIELLEKGRRRTDVGKVLMEDLGFNIGIWNGGKSAKMVGLSVTCGLYSTAPGLGGNCVVIDLPEELEDLQQSGRMANVLVAVAISWEPDWAGVLSIDAMNKRNFNPAFPFVDWMVYLSLKLVPDPKVPEPSIVRPVDGIGSLVVVQQEPTEADNAAHLQRIKAVEAALGIKG